MLNFFSELVDEERPMSASKFSSLWNLAAATKLKESRTNRGLIESGVPEFVASERPTEQEPIAAAPATSKHPSPHRTPLPLEINQPALLLPKTMHAHG